MDAGSIQERQHLAEIACALGLKGVTVADFQHIVCPMVDSGSSAIAPYNEDFCPLITTQKNQAVIFTYLDVFFTNQVYDSTNITRTSLTTPILGRWVDQLNLTAGIGSGIFKAYSVQLPIKLMINRPLIHVGLGDRMVGLGIAQPQTANFLEISAVGYLVSQEIGTAFKKLETLFTGSAADVGGQITSSIGVDAATGQQKTAPGL